MATLTKKALVFEFESLKDKGNLRAEYLTNYLNSLNTTVSNWNMLFNLFYAFIDKGEDVIEFESLEIGE